VVGTVDSIAVDLVDGRVEGTNIGQRSWQRKLRGFAASLFELRITGTVTLSDDASKF
jgi:hypothetical protein